MADEIIEQKKEPIQIDPDTATFVEKVLVIGVLGTLAIVCMWKGSLEGATGFATAIVTYASSRKGV